MAAWEGVALACLDSGNSPGLWLVSTHSGTLTAANCDASIGPLQHIVQVFNLKAKSMNVLCVASIESQRKTARFVSPNPRDSDDEWEADKQNVTSTDGFDHVQIESVASGSATILVEIFATWPLRRRSDLKSLRINVVT
jgi:hypothetical protein